jgi:PAS domain S-box-containing protein
VSIAPGDVGRIVEVNDALCCLLGYSRDELVGGRPPAALDHPDDADVGAEHIRRLISGEIEKCHFEKRFVRRDGAVLTIDLTVSAAMDDGSSHARFALCHCLDVSQ